MPTVIYVPGFSASELHLNAERSRLYWVDLSRILLLSPGAMRLNAAGTGPGGSDGLSMWVGRPLTPWADVMLTLLRQQLGPRGYDVVTHPWDWRMDLLAAGEQLADRILDLADAEEPCALIGHSAGGLVCRAAWTSLRGRLQDVRIRRIITLGTPHWGTYYGVSLWSGVGDLVDQLASFGQISGGLLGSASAQLAGVMAVSAIVGVALTWPALYQLLPLVGAPDAAEDPHRELLYTAGDWHGPGGQPSVAHLAAVQAVRDPWLNSATSKPPSWVMTAVSGSGWGTPWALRTPSILGSPRAIAQGGAGDGVVTEESAIGGFPVSVSLNCRHSDLPRTTAASGLLAELVLDPRGPTDPVPAAEVLTGINPALTGGPPLNVLSLQPGGVRPCVGPDCVC